MRALPVRRLSSPLLCAALLLGTAGPVAAAADGGPASDRSRTGTSVSGADALLKQVRSLAAHGGVLSPVTDLLDATLEADHGRLSDARAAVLGRAAKDAVARAAADPSALAPQAGPDAQARPERAAGGKEAGKQAVPLLPSGVSAVSTLLAPLPPAKNATLAQAQRAGKPRDVTQDALTELQQAVDALLKAATSDDTGQVVPAATDLVNDLVDVVAATVLGADPAGSRPSGLLHLSGLLGLTGLLPSSAGVPPTTLPAPEDSSSPQAAPSAPALPLLPSDLVLPSS